MLIWSEPQLPGPAGSAMVQMMRVPPGPSRRTFNALRAPDRLSASL